MDDEESLETESEVQSPREMLASQRRTSTRTKKPTKRFGIDIDLVNDEEDVESEEMRGRLRSLRLFETGHKETVAQRRQ